MIFLVYREFAGKISKIWSSPHFGRLAKPQLSRCLIRKFPKQRNRELTHHLRKFRTRIRVVKPSIRNFLSYPLACLYCSCNVRLFIKKWMSWKRQSLTQFAVEPQNRGRAPKPRLSLNIPTFEIAPYCVHKRLCPHAMWPWQSRSPCSINPMIKVNFHAYTI